VGERVQQGEPTRFKSINYARVKKLLLIKKEISYRSWCMSIVDEIMNFFKSAIEYCENPYTRKDECIRMLKTYFQKAKEYSYQYFYNVSNDYEYVKEIIRVANEKGYNYVKAKFNISKSTLSKYKKVVEILSKYEDEFYDWFSRLSKTQLVELAYELEKYPEIYRRCMLYHLSILPLPSEIHVFRKKIRELLHEFKSICYFETQHLI